MSEPRKSNRLVSYDDSSGESDVETDRDNGTNTVALETDFFGFIDHTDSSTGNGTSASVSSCMPTSICYDAVSCNEAEGASVSSSFFTQTTFFGQGSIPCESGSPKPRYPFEYGPSREQTFQGLSSALTDEQARNLISKFEAEPFGRSLPETLHIIDVSVDDYMRDVRENVLRNVSLPKPPTLSSTGGVADEKAKPTMVAKQKHQITYLAHLAKEREGQLEQQWAQNRQRRREARLKYGF